VIFVFVYLSVLEILFLRLVFGCICLYCLSMILRLFFCAWLMRLSGGSIVSVCIS